EDSVLWWLDRMVAAEHQFAEKLVFFWHGHWATSVEKVRSAAAMLRQQQTFRDLGAGDFGPFLKAMLRDPALIIWLDGQQNTRAAPNENLARESMELFTLGVGNYTEADVRAAARALTGWQVRRGDLTATFNPRRHDPGDKTVLGMTGAYDADGYADVLLAQPANVRFLAGRPAPPGCRRPGPSTGWRSPHCWPARPRGRCSTGCPRVGSTGSRGCWSWTGSPTVPGRSSRTPVPIRRSCWPSAWPAPSTRS